MIIGLDEAGRGALAGPVVAAAVLEVPELSEQDYIADSKKLTDKQRRQAFTWLTDNAVFGVGVVSARDVDEIGIKPATEQAMNLALEKLLSKAESEEEIKLLVDGRDRFKFPYPSQDIVKGDEKESSISAASILAKVTRDDYMIAAHDKFPDFGFKDHKGYGAASHYELLDQGLFCTEHRKTYDPLKTWLTQGRLF